jgi:hypothetical protein
MKELSFTIRDLEGGCSLILLNARKTSPEVVEILSKVSFEFPDVKFSNFSKSKREINFSIEVKNENSEKVINFIKENDK